MTEANEHKYKGTKGPAARQGLGRLRRANSKTPGRVSGWERRHEDVDFVDQHGDSARTGHGGDTLLARFNRLVQGERLAEVQGEYGEICGSNGAIVDVRAANGEEIPCHVRQVLKKRIKGVKNPLCVGDQVRFVRTAMGGTITSIEPRRNQLERADSHNRALIHVFAANLDCLVIVSALAEPDFKAGLIDRYLLIAAGNGIPAAVVLNKCDLADPAPACNLYRGIGIPTFAVSARSGNGDLAQLREHLRGRTCVLAGQSGVGKSSLLNALYPDIAARVGAVAQAGFGRHTTSSARSYALSDGVRLIDTPGVRECSITGLGALDVALLYPDLSRYQASCRFTNCSHTHEPGCAVLAALAEGRIAASRYGSYLSIITEDLAESPPS